MLRSKSENAPWWGGGYAFNGRKKLLWDGDAMKITNYDDANQFVAREYRKGWEI